MTTQPSNSESFISPLAFVHPDATIGKHVSISPFAYIEQDVIIGDYTTVAPNATILSGTRIGRHCQIFSGAVIGAIPQDLKFKGEYSTVEIGDYTIIRECVTINRGTQYAQKTVIGNHCLLMAYVHVAHDCILGNRLVLANSVNLAGHVKIDDYAILEGVVAVQQFVHIGKHSFVAGGSLVRKNIPPYIKAAREPLSYVGVNSIGLTRRGFTKDTINAIQRIYSHLFVRSANMRKALQVVENDLPNSPEKQEIIAFIKQSEKGVIKGFRALESNGVHKTL